MEGVLWKWTNYLSGWQPRWFVLESGVLSYYKSQEDVNNGCKGSIKMSACDIKVHPTDNTRLDLIIPGEQHYYVKAAQPQERQSWLIALGSAKATYGQPSSQEPSCGGDVVVDAVRAKKSELRLYCDLLMQQVHSVKQSVMQKESEKARVPDAEKLNEATSLLSATCDTFIQTLDEVMKLVHDAPHSEASHPSSPKRLSSANSRLSVSRSNSQEMSARSRLPSASSLDGPGLIRHRSKSLAESDTSHLDAIGSDILSAPTSSSCSRSSKDSPQINHTPSEKQKGFENRVKTKLEQSSTSVIKNAENGTAEMARSSADARNDDGEGADDFKDAIDVRTATFFSAMSTSFANIKLLDDYSIPVQPFLDACRELVPIFDKLNSTAFAPVKMDFSGNIRKIQQKQVSSIGTGSAGFQSLQSMVLSEVHSRQHTNSNSATVALCWLKRGLEFIREFLREICSGGPDLAECASNAYSRTLKKYHGWVVRGVFAVAVKALPYRDEFLRHMAVEEIETIDDNFISLLMNDMEIYLQHMNSIIHVISQFYTSHNLDIEEQV